MNILFGVGNSLRGDDGAGCYVADHFHADGWIVVNCATAPENFTGIVRKHHPDLLVIVDAAAMSLAPGAVRRIAPESIEDVGVGTHMLPLSHLIDFLATDAGEIVLIGIQPGDVDTCDVLSPAVREGADALISILASGRIANIDALEGTNGKII
ncbi:hydrogenase 3 maturation endopeptidase HyCI [Methanomicrobiaceae archaeon CYW5]|uniref:hydrogenase maturation peptidase HycI n=1 Tax=Methanovulcanius yangii TaxID=1789227 RepID=UPI0029C9FAD5|nr:hydrogenase maturation peptidase HycI [Methanovulcanius yangii]MBT8507739.1 hydrogenase 3 maturation endopeptidase HyCI [Methanovulcanius yangii]